MDAKQTILTRQLPKTGQTRMYKFNDDGAVRAGWWRGEVSAPYKTRFISKTIGVNGDVVVIDRATGLMWAADGNAGGCAGGVVKTWNEAIDYTPDPIFAGFEDWRLPNINELVSIVNFSKSSPPIDETFFPNTESSNYWSSTTYKDDIAQAWQVQFTSARVVFGVKGLSHYLRCVRGGL